MKPRKTTLDERCAALKARLTAPSKTPSESELLTPKEAMKRWGQSENKTRDHFSTVKGCRVIGNPRRFDRSKNKYIQKYYTVLIPPEILEAEILRTTVQ